MDITSLNTFVKLCLENNCYLAINRDYHFFKELNEHAWGIRVYLSPNNSEGSYIEYFRVEEINNIDWEAFYLKAFRAALDEGVKLGRIKSLKKQIKERLKDRFEREAKKREGQELLRCLV